MNVSRNLWDFYDIDFDLVLSHIEHNFTVFNIFFNSRNSTSIQVDFTDFSRVSIHNITYKREALNFYVRTDEFISAHVLFSNDLNILKCSIRYSLSDMFGIEDRCNIVMKRLNTETLNTCSSISDDLYDVRESASFDYCLNSLKLHDLSDPEIDKIFMIRDKKARESATEDLLAYKRGAALNDYYKYNIMRKSLFSVSRIECVSQHTLDAKCHSFISFFRKNIRIYSNNDFNLGTIHFSNIRLNEKSSISDIYSCLLGVKRTPMSVKSLIRKDCIASGRYYSYKVLNVDGFIDVKAVRVNFSEGFDYSRSRRNTKEISKLPIIKTAYCRFKSFTPIRYFTGKLRISYGHDEFINFALNDEVTLNEFTVKEATSCMILANWRTVISTVNRMAAGSGTRPNTPVILDYLKSCADVIRLPIITRSPTVNDLHCEPINGESHPGALSRRFIGTKKADCYNISLKLAIDLFVRMEKGEIVTNSNVWCIGGREKQYYCELLKEPRTRHVYMPELYHTIFANIYARPITRGIKALQRKFSDYKLLIGYNYFGGNWQEFHARFEKYNNMFLNDYEGYDSTFSEELSIICFGILRACFPESDTIDRHFGFIASGFIFKNLLTPDGVLYKLHNGIPSGDPFTSLIGTIGNIISQLCVFRMMGINVLDFGASGDDSITALSDSTHVDFNKFNDLLSLTFGLKGDGRVTSKFDNYHVDENQCNFLQTYSFNGLPVRLPSVVIDRNLIPKKFGGSHMLAIERSLSILSSGPFHPLNLHISHGYMKHLLVKLGIKNLNGEFDSNFHNEKAYNTLGTIFATYFDKDVHLRINEGQYDSYINKNTYCSAMPWVFNTS